MKLIFILLIFISSIYASNIKELQVGEEVSVIFGTNHDIPQKGITPKNKKTLQFYIRKRKDTGAVLSTTILSDEDKTYWEISDKPLVEKECSGGFEHPLNNNNIKFMDLNLLRYLLESYPRTQEQNDITVRVKVKKGRDIDNKNFKIFSLTKNEYLNDFPPSYTICLNVDSYAYGNIKKSADNIHIRYRNELSEKKQKIIDIQKRKNIKYADMSDQGLILEVKEPLVKVQYIIPVSSWSNVANPYLPVQKWIRIDELTFQEQND